MVIAGPDQMGWGAKLKRVAAEAGIGGTIRSPGVLSATWWRVPWGRRLRPALAPGELRHRGRPEALACSTPVLISDKVNIWREVEAGVRDRLVAPDDEAGTVSLLERFLALDELSRARMREAARTCFERHFDVTASAST